eukprot:8878465-Heterocapsa_arctica.AAC.1
MAGALLSSKPYRGKLTVELTKVLNQIERDSAWPDGLRGALVACLPKKDDHSPMAQRPISLVPF